MKIVISCRIALGLMILAALILAPSPGMAQEKGGDWGKYKELKEKMAKELKLNPEKTKQFLEVGERYIKLRQELSETVEKSYAELEKVLAAPKPEEAKVKALVRTITMTHDRFVNSYKAERSEEFALLSPLEQGSYLLTTRKKRMEHFEKRRKPEKKEHPEKKEPPEKK